MCRQYMSTGFLWKPPTGSASAVCADNLIFVSATATAGKEGASHGGLTAEE